MAAGFRRLALLLLSISPALVGALVLAFYPLAGADFASAERATGALPAPRPAPSPPSATLILEPTDLDLGRLETGTPRRVEVGWRRAGTGDLRIHGVSSDCGCALPDDLPGILPAGSTGRLAVVVHPPRRPGPFSSRLRIVAGDRLHRVRLHGFVEREWRIVPDDLDLGPRTAGTTLERTLEIRTTRAAAANPIAASLEGLDGRVEVLPPSRAGAWGSQARVRLTVPVVAGAFEGVLVFRMEKRPAIRVRVAGRSVDAGVPGVSVRK